MEYFAYSKQANMPYSPHPGFMLAYLAHCKCNGHINLCYKPRQKVYIPLGKSPIIPNPTQALYRRTNHETYPGELFLRFQVHLLTFRVKFSSKFVYDAVAVRHCLRARHACAYGWLLQFCSLPFARFLWDSDRRM